MRVFIFRYRRMCCKQWKLQPVCYMYKYSWRLQLYVHVWILWRWIQLLRCVFICVMNESMKKTRNARQSLAYSPLGAAVSPLAWSSETKPCYHLTNVQRMHVVSLPWQRPLTNWKIRTCPSSAHKGLSHVVRLRKSVQYIRRYSTK